jgi:hypothetical protein
MGYDGLLFAFPDTVDLDEIMTIFKAKNGKSLWVERVPGFWVVKAIFEKEVTVGT